MRPLTSRITLKRTSSAAPRSAAQNAKSFVWGPGAWLNTSILYLKLICIWGVIVGGEKNCTFLTERQQSLRFFFFLFFQATLYILSISSLYQQPSVDTLRLMALVCHLKSLNICAAVLVKSYVLQVFFFWGGAGGWICFAPITSGKLNARWQTSTIVCLKCLKLFTVPRRHSDLSSTDV